MRQGKWSIRDVMNHLADCERLFVARAFWFARGFESPLPSFDQEVAVSAAHADNRPWADIVVEFEAVRGATIAFFRSLPADGVGRGAVSPAATRSRFGRSLTCASGTFAHHMAILRERYLSA